MEPMKLRNLENNVDRISDLPDVLIHHIFAFLDARHAVQASLLSKRWRNLWKSLPSLKFWHNGGHMNDFVDRVLTLRDRSINLQRFNLICVSCDIANCLDRWIHTAVMDNVEEVSIKGYYEYSNIEVPPPPYLFTCKSLTKLELKNIAGYDIIQDFILPDSVSLPSLKTLDLCFFTFFEDGIINQFFSSCPELESLTIQNCNISHINLHISCPKLKHLKLESCVSTSSWEVKTVELNAPSLLSFRCEDYILSKDYSLENLCSLVEADISIPREEYQVADQKEMNAQSAVQLLEGLHNVKRLTISTTLVKPLLQARAGLKDPLTPFSNLHFLKIKTCFSMRHSHDAILYLLLSCPRLETFVLVQNCNVPKKKTKKNCGSDVDECQDMEFPSQFKLHHLKFVKIGYSRCNKNELEFSMFLLKNAEVLEKMTVSISSSSQTRSHNFRDGLLGCPRAAPNAILSASSLYGYF